MGSFGQLILCVSVLTSAAGGAMVLSSGGDKRRLQAGTSMLYAAAISAATALVVLTFALVTHDYSISYVRDYADRSMTLSFLITAVWGGQEGSLLFWAALQTFFTAGMILWPGKHSQRLMPVALGVMAIIQTFFLLLVLFHSNPFAELGTTATRGTGINPLLRNFYMAFHPPTLFLGFVGFSVPMAYIVAVLAEGALEDDWIDDLRPWVLVAWIFLSIGNILGMVWAYEELGWGGYWAWDPVENASFLPWLTGTALAHTLLVRKQRGGFKIWTVVLSLLTFALVIFGTFLTRSGVIESVHAFAGATTGPYFLGMIVASVALVIVLGVWRRDRLFEEESDEPKPLLRRENIFVATNIAFIAATAFVWAGTMMPLFTTLLMGEKVAVTPASFNRWMAPAGLVIFLLIAVCAVIGWQAVSLKRLGRRAIGPLLVGAVVALLAVLNGGIPERVEGLMKILPIISYAFLGVVGAVVLKDVKVLLSSSGETNVVARRRRLGGQLVHLSMVLMFLGFTGAAYTVDRSNSIAPGQSMVVGDYRVKLLGMREDSDLERYALFADLEVRKDRRLIGIFSPARYQYHSHPGQPTSEVAIRSTLNDDLFLVLGEVDSRSGRAVIRALVNPLVLWLWLSGVLLTLGAAIALFPAGWSFSLAEINWQDKRTVYSLGGWSSVLVLFLGAYAIFNLPIALAVLAGALLLSGVAFMGLSFNSLLETGGD